MKTIFIWKYLFYKQIKDASLNISKHFSCTVCLCNNNYSLMWANIQIAVDWGSDTVVHIIDNISFYKQYRITNMRENYIHTQTYLHEESPKWTMYCTDCFLVFLVECSQSWKFTFYKLSLLYPHSILSIQCFCLPFGWFAFFCFLKGFWQDMNSVEQLTRD